MVVLLKTSGGVEKAVEMADGGWEAIPISNDMSKVRIVFRGEEGDDSVIVNITDYDKLKEELFASNSILDYTNI